jgi:hypothetical protein
MENLMKTITTKPYENNTKNPQPSNQQAHPTYDRELTTPRAPQRKEDPHNGQPTEGFAACLQV